MEEPRNAALITESLEILPKAVLPCVLSVDPRRAKDRTDNVLPTAHSFAIETVFPNLAKDLTDNEEPT